MINPASNQKDNMVDMGEEMEILQYYMSPTDIFQHKK